LENKRPVLAPPKNTLNLRVLAVTDNNHLLAFPDKLCHQLLQFLHKGAGGVDHSKFFFFRPGKNFRPFSVGTDQHRGTVRDSFQAVNKNDSLFCQFLYQAFIMGKRPQGIDGTFGGSRPCQADSLPYTAAKACIFRNNYLQGMLILSATGAGERFLP
jgi:hypothetical protein